MRKNTDTDSTQNLDYKIRNLHAVKDSPGRNLGRGGGNEGVISQNPLKHQRLWVNVDGSNLGSTSYKLSDFTS